MLQKYFQKALESVEPQTLYIVATPIGNLSDITLRALAVLKKVDCVCAEDTRVSNQLLSAYGIQAKLISVREHNEQQMADKIISLLESGQSVAQISDAGTPAICDPGAKLVEKIRQAGFKVVPVVGASAVMGALSVAGVTEPNFYFYGFLPPKSNERLKVFDWFEQTLNNTPIVMFETPHRIVATLDDMANTFPDRKLVLAREITKTFETFLSGTVLEIQSILQADSNQMRGEMVLILHPKTPTPKSRNQLENISENAQNIMKILSAELPTKQAADLTAKITGENKKDLYQLALSWKNAD